MREIAQRLMDEDWSLIDLTLRQFGLPILQQWNGGTKDYILRMIEDGKEDVLVELARHLGFQLQSTESSPEPTFWKEGTFRLFISHLAKHRRFAAELQASLVRFGIWGFVAHSDIEPTQEWQIAIETALATCDALVALLHSDFHQSSWTDQEIGFAMGRGLPVSSVRLGQDPYGFIGRFQAFDGKSKSADALASELFDAYRKNKQTQGKMADILVRLFIESRSFATVRDRIGYLEELEVWEASFSERVLAAAKSNDQIFGSWGVTDRVNALINRWAKKGV
jgi:TIR domain